MPATPDTIDRLKLAAASLLTLADDLAEGEDVPHKRIRSTCAKFESAVAKVRGACLDAISAEADVDMDDPSELIGELIARSNRNEATLPDLGAHDRATYRSQVA